MAYSLGDRFPRPSYNYRLLEPGSYQYERCDVKQNKVPFLSSAARITNVGNRIWTHTLYIAEPSRKIANCTSLKSKIVRFPHEALSKQDDMESILCRCGLDNVCECTKGTKQKPEQNCHGKLHRKIFKGPTPRSETQGLSAPSRSDNGFEEQPDGTYKRIFNVNDNQGPPFYNAQVTEATAFYQGCKWSRWRSSRATEAREKKPGPADYSLVRPPNPEQICAEKIREQKRKHSKQTRYIEMVHQKNMLEQRPGPATYSPNYRSGSELKYFGTKANRFYDPKCTKGPGPAEYCIRRDFDPTETPDFFCLAKLTESAGFGGKAERFKPHKEEGPSSASYDLNKKQCNFINCSKAPFGSNSVRFKQTAVEDDIDLDRDDCDKDLRKTKICLKPTWEFKSKTTRMPPLQKMSFEQSPADLPMDNFQIKRSTRLQKTCPFGCSEGRFHPWNDWLPVFARLEAPGPGYYNFENYKCLPSFSKGPLCRAERFPANRRQSPAPNEYNVGGGVETVLATHNEKLKNNITNQHTFHWTIPTSPVELSLLEQEDLILDNAISALDVVDDIITRPKTDYVPDTCECNTAHAHIKPKMLRSFLYRHPIQPYF